jgi:2-octaprenyl-6-methoxyphenol hydroxylase
VSAAPPEFDLAVVGGGLAGNSLACALAGCGLRIAVLEAQVPDAGAARRDGRSLALAYGTRRIFEGLGVWSALAAAATPIERIHVSDRGHFGMVHMDCRDQGLEALGYVLPIATLAQVLGEAAAQLRQVRVLAPARVEAVAVEAGRVRVGLAAGAPLPELHCRLLVVAEGGRSALRERLGIGARERDYGHSAVVADVTPERFHQYLAYERFTESGPLALLPLPEGRCALVWSLAPDAAERAVQVPTAEFLRRLQAAFGFRLGRFRGVGERQAYPLRLVEAAEQVRPRLVLLGNAAHTLHPIAGQGFNLALRDVAVLAEVLAAAVAAGDDPGDLAVLQRYQRLRRADQRRVVGFTDVLARLFSLRFPGVVLARELGLLALELAPPLKHLLTRHAMGIAGRVPRLASGCPLCPGPVEPAPGGERT